MTTTPRPSSPAAVPCRPRRCGRSQLGIQLVRAALVVFMVGGILQEMQLGDHPMMRTQIIPSTPSDRTTKLARHHDASKFRITTSTLPAGDLLGWFRPTKQKNNLKKIEVLNDNRAIGDGNQADQQSGYDLVDLEKAKNDEEDDDDAVYNQNGNNNFDDDNNNDDDEQQDDTIPEVYTEEEEEEDEEQGKHGINGVHGLTAPVALVGPLHRRFQFDLAAAAGGGGDGVHRYWSGPRVIGRGGNHHHHPGSLSLIRMDDPQLEEMKRMAETIMTQQQQGWLPPEQLDAILRNKNKKKINPKAKSLMQQKEQKEKQMRRKYGDRFGERLAMDGRMPSSSSSSIESFSSLLLQDAKNLTLQRSERMRNIYSQQIDYQPLPIPAPTKDDPTLQTFMQTHHEDCAGKEHMLRQLKAANITLTQTICQRLPTWKEVTELYGSGPVVLGLETCSDYRERLRNNTHYPPKAAVAGLWNSGTTALSMSFQQNLDGFRSSTDISEPTVPWGKHTPLYLKYHNTWPKEKRSSRDREMKDHILPVLIVRDPFRWMKTMCHKQYDAIWQFGWKNRCPNFIPTQKERDRLYLNSTTFKVFTNPRQTYYRRFTKYDSLAELWSSFNEEYLYSEAPRLIIRAEDTFFHPKQLMEIISNCSGMPLKRDGDGEDGFHYFAQKSKKGSGTNWLQAMAKYGSDKGRFPGTITSAEKRYLQTALSPTLMKLLHYPQIPVSGTAVGSNGEESIREKKMGS